MMTAAHPEWISIALLGALHGVNPAMGWLFAASLGLQAQSGRAVWFALAPLALGHALSVAAALAAGAVLGMALPPALMRWIAAAALLGFGVLHLRPHTHPRWLSGVGGMCVGPRQLTTWSFLVSSAHGAGLMLLPFVLGRGPTTLSGNADVHAAHLAGVVVGDAGGQATALFATLLHTAGYFAVAGAIAWVVYERLGVRFLRSAWINMNVVWAGALIVTAAATPFL